jgi:hypothetical protein
MVSGAGRVGSKWENKGGKTKVSGKTKGKTKVSGTLIECHFDQIGQNEQVGIVVWARRTTAFLMLPKRGALVQGQFAASRYFGGQGIKPY